MTSLLLETATLIYIPLHETMPHSEKLVSKLCTHS